MNMRNPSSFLLALAIGISLSHRAYCQAPAAASTIQTHPLWKVQGTKAPVYLLGSLHLLKPGDYPLPAQIESAFSNAQVVYFETDIAKLEDPAFQTSLMTKGLLPEGETLKSRLSPETYKKFSELAEQAGLPVVMCERMKPSLAAIMLTVIEIQKLGFDPYSGVDKHFSELARKQGKELGSFETPEFQLDLLTGFSKEEDELVMKITLEDLEKEMKEFQDLVKAWKAGDGDKIEKYLNEASQQAPAIYKRLLTDRNEHWVPKIEELARGDKPAIVIVGAGHLVGKDGVVALLKKKGLKVTQE